MKSHNAVSSGRIIGPAIYGTMYAITVSFMPSAILWLSVGSAATAFLVLTLVRLPDCASTIQNSTEQQDGDLAHDDNTELDPLLEPNSV